MKIYCARRYNSDQEFFDSLIGKDVWVKVVSKYNGYVSWTRLLGKDEHGEYICNVLSDFGHYPTQTLQRKKIFTDYTCTFSFDQIEIFKPVEMVSSDEIFI